MGALHLLIINQHGENRGDESALRAVVRSLTGRLGTVRFTVLTQFRDRRLSIPFREDVRLHNMLIKEPVQLAGLVLYGWALRVGIRPRFLLSRRAAEIVRAYESADLVLNAPGGPYLGDIYADHELLHWFYIWLAKRHRKAVFQYACSAGPFRIRSLNWLRRRFYPMIDRIVVREELSAGHLRELLGPETALDVTIDAAIQDEIPPMRREDYFQEERAPLRERFIVGVTANNYRYPGATDVAAKRAAYNQAMADCMAHLAGRRRCHFLFFPQLYGRVHSDVAYHHYLAKRLPAGATWELVDPDASSDTQRALYGMVDFTLASRYHPQIFATTQGVPGVFVWYEHKQVGYLRQLGLEDYLFDIRNLDGHLMIEAIDRALDQRERLATQIRERLPAVQALSRKTTDLLIALLGELNAGAGAAARPRG